MAAITWAIVTGFYPQGGFETVPVVAQDMILEFVNTQLRPEKFDGEDGITTKFARLYLAAHLGVGAKPSADNDDPVAGPVSAESTGDVSRSYVLIPTTISEGIWSSTEYGRAYERLVQTSPARVGFTV